MCKTKMALDAAQPTRSPRTSRPALQSPKTQSSRSAAAPQGLSQRSAASSLATTIPPPATRSSSPSTSSSSYPSTSIHYSSTGGHGKDSINSLSSLTSSLSSLRDTLPETPIVYDISEIRSATNNFLSKRYSSSTTPSWLCNLRSKEVIIFQRKSRSSMGISQLQKKLSAIYKSHYSSIIKLLGACISSDHIYLVYEFVHGASLSSCLRNPRNPNFTVLSTWMSRMQVATDLAHGLDYIHTNMNFVHNHVKSSSVIVIEPSFNAKICHFGTAQLCGEVDEADAINDEQRDQNQNSKEPQASAPSPLSPGSARSRDHKPLNFQGTVGYMSPEFQSIGVPTKKSDVYAFGVVLLELLSGEEPFKYKVEKDSGDIKRTSVIDTAADAVSEDGGGGLGKEARVRRWVDKRLRDSFPVEVAEKVIRVALDCVHVDVDQRPDMRRAAGKISKLYLDSVKWSNSLNVPTDMISVSFAPR
ncbi:hypothetical protein QQ045_024382 [Rhodiola kirilowii]